ncbi:MAG: orotidine-5'-phosphate decarboxylase [Chlorobi bacterium]|nr:orotidine-5'-phosphate decarboxylase [Chlorobiota bacterium]
MKSKEKLISAFDKGLHVCVGLDSDINKIPKHLLAFDDPVFEFNKAIIEATKDFSAAYKLNFAFYESEGIGGLSAMEKTLKYIPENIFTIADAKRGDIGNSSAMYAKSVFEHFGFDSVTLHPLMGGDSLSPFFEYEDKVHFILALTSNPGSADFEKLKLSNKKYLFQEVIKKTNDWNENVNLGIVFGATNSDELRENIDSFEDLFVLLPGVGAQGGSLEEIVKIFSEKKSRNFLVNISRALIYAGSDKYFSQACRDKLIDYNEIIYKFL